MTTNVPAFTKEAIKNLINTNELEPVFQQEGDELVHNGLFRFTDSADLYEITQLEEDKFYVNKV